MDEKSHSPDAPVIKHRAMSVSNVVNVALLCGIVILIAGLGVTAVNKVREAAGRARSMNNIRKIVEAVQQHHAVLGYYPCVCDYGSGAPSGIGLTSIFFNIRFGLNLFEFDGIITSPEQYAWPPLSSPRRGIACRVEKVFLSPGDPSAPSGTTVVGITIDGINIQIPPGTYATTNYAFNGMLFSPQPDPLNPGMTVTPTVKTLADGASQTIMVTERYQVCKMGNGLQPPTSGSQDVYTLWALGAYGAQAPAFALPLPEGIVPTSRPALTQFVPQSPVTATILGSHGAAQYAPLGAAISAPCGFQTKPRGSVMCDARVPQAIYGESLLVGMGDGSVRTIRNNINPVTFWSAVTPAGGEALGADW